MSLAWYIVLERKIPGLDDTVNGKAVAKNADQLDSIAAEKKVPTLMSFFGAADGELADFAANHDVVPARLNTRQWFSPNEGLTTINLLIKVAAEHKLDSPVIADLQQFKAILEAAKRDGIRWHLAVDF